MSNIIDPTSLHEQDLPTDPFTRQAILDRRLLIVSEVAGTFVYDAEKMKPWLETRMFPLEHAHFLQEKYPVLIDRRSLPTEADKQASPGMYSFPVMHAQHNINVPQVAREIADAFEDLREVQELPLVLSQHVRELQGLLAEYVLISDRRFHEPLQNLLQQAAKESYPLTFEAIHELPEPDRPLYYKLKYALNRARIIVSWYNKEKLYSLCDISRDSQIGDKYTVVSSNPEKALIEFAAHLVANRHYMLHVSWWKLYENDTVIREVSQKDTVPEDLFELAEKWRTRSDEEIDGWLE
jgi:hypothetical protein